MEIGNRFLNDSHSKPSSTKFLGHAESNSDGCPEAFRAFRIGQKRNVLVHKFVCRGTLEEKIDKMIRDKKSISQELFSEESELNLTEMSNQQLLQFVALDINKAST